MSPFEIALLLAALVLSLLVALPLSSLTSIASLWILGVLLSVYFMCSGSSWIGITQFAVTTVLAWKLLVFELFSRQLASGHEKKSTQLRLFGALLSGAGFVVLIGISILDDGSARTATPPRSLFSFGHELVSANYLAFLIFLFGALALIVGAALLARPNSIKEEE